jgi:hypothetical protein
MNGSTGKWEVWDENNLLRELVWDDNHVGRKHGRMLSNLYQVVRKEEVSGRWIQGSQNMGPLILTIIQSGTMPFFGDGICTSIMH